MLTINWSDINLNGMPAIQRALETLVKGINTTENRQDLERHWVEEWVTQTETRICLLEDTLIDLAHAFAEKATPPADVPLNASAATSAPVAAPKAAAYRGGAELTDLGLSYAEVDASLRRLDAAARAGGVPGDSWLPADACWVTQFAAAKDDK